MSDDLVLEMKKITKDFNGVVVLRDVDLEVRRGEVYALIGANGAGKSTSPRLGAGKPQDRGPGAEPLRLRQCHGGLNAGSGRHGGASVGIVQDSIQSQIYEVVKHDILYKKYAMGDKLNPRLLAKQYLVSVMPIRDALLQLARRGLVVNRARVGFYVARYTGAEAMEFIEVRIMHELFCLERYFDDISAAGLAKHLDRMRDGVERNDTETFNTGDSGFHDVIVNSAKNDFLRIQYDQIRDLLTLLMYYDTEHDADACAEHEEILRAVRAGDRAGAIAALEKHLKRAAAQIVRYLDDADGDGRA